MTYRFYINGILFFDTEIDELAVIDPVVTTELNKAGSFTFTVPNTHPHVSDIEALTSVVGVFYLEPGSTLENYIFCGPVTKVIETMFGEKKVICEGALGLLNRTYNSAILGFDMSKYTPETVMKALAVSSNRIGSNLISITGGTCNVTNTQGVKEILFDNYPTRMEGIMRLEKLFGGYFDLALKSKSRNTTSGTMSYALELNYKKSLIMTATQELVMGQNLISLDVDIDEPNVFNTVIPVGSQVSKWSRYKGTSSKVQALINKYGTIEKMVTWDDQTDATVLTALGQQYLTDNLYKTITAKAHFIDLCNVDRDYYPLKVAYKVKVFSPKQGINREMLIIGRTFNLTDPGNDTLTLSATEEYDVS